MKISLFSGLNIHQLVKLLIGINQQDSSGRQ